MYRGAPTSVNSIKTKEDLTDMLVPYFKAELENNESCIWATSEPLREKEARKAIREAVPDLDRHVERRRMEIAPHAEGYPKGDALNLQKVPNDWVDERSKALTKGYDGVKCTIRFLRVLGILSN